MKDVSELPANAMSFVSPPPTSTPVKGYQAFALRRGVFSGWMITHGWTDDKPDLLEACSEEVGISDAEEGLDKDVQVVALLHT